MLVHPLGFAAFEPLDCVAIGAEQLIHSVVVTEHAVVVCQPCTVALPKLPLSPTVNVVDVQCPKILEPAPDTAATVFFVNLTPQSSLTFCASRFRARHNDPP